MTSPSCYGSVRLERVRFALLDPDTLAPLAGSSNGYVTDAQVSLNVSDVNETGDTFTQKNGGGRICVDTQDDDTFKRVQIQLVFCQLDPLIGYFLAGERLFRDASSRVIGSQSPVAGSSVDRPVCIEAWTRAWEGASQATAPTTSPSLTYHHWVFPYAHGFTLQPVDMGNGVHVFQYNGLGDDNAAVTTNGPFNDWPTYMVDEGLSGARAHFFDDSPPDATCSLIGVPAGS